MLLANSKTTDSRAVFSADATHLTLITIILAGNSGILGEADPVHTHNPRPKCTPAAYSKHRQISKQHETKNFSQNPKPP